MSISRPLLLLLLAARATTCSPSPPQPQCADVSADDTGIAAELFSETRAVLEEPDWAIWAARPLSERERAPAVFRRDAASPAAAWAALAPPIPRASPEDDGDSDGDAAATTTTRRRRRQHLAATARLRLGERLPTALVVDKSAGPHFMTTVRGAAAMHGLLDDKRAPLAFARARRANVTAGALLRRCGCEAAADGDGGGGGGGEPSSESGDGDYYYYREQLGVAAPDLTPELRPLDWMRVDDRRSVPTADEALSGSDDDDERDDDDDGDDDDDDATDLTQIFTLWMCGRAGCTTQVRARGFSPTCAGAVAARGARSGEGGSARGPAWRWCGGDRA